MRPLRKLCAVLLAILLVLSLGVPAAFAAEESYYLTWDEYQEANGITSWNYNDQAAVIAGVANYAVELYASGRSDEAYEYAKATYWGYYEVSGFERNTMNYISGSRVSEVELAFTNFRKSIKKDQGVEAAQEAADTLIDMLTTDGAILSPEGASSAGTDGAVSTGSFSYDNGYFLTWDEFTEAYSVSAWNYNDQAVVISDLADYAVELYAEGDADQAYEFAKATYWGYYEVSGFERNTMNYISGSRVSEVELAFTNFRKSIKKDQGVEAAQEAADALSEMLVNDGNVLSPEGAVFTAAESVEATGAEADTSTSGTSVGSAVAVFLGSFAIILREGLEAILIVGAIIAYLIKSGKKNQVLPVYIGSAMGVVFSFLMAAVLNWLLARSAEYHMSQEVIEGIAALTAVVVLFWVSNWMVSKSESAAWTEYIEGQVASSSGRGSVFALGFTAWLAVFREGAEVILFYQPMLAEDRPDMVWLGFGVGVAALVVVFLLIRFLSIKLPLKPFFMGTSILMAIMSISFLGAGIKELIEGAVFEEIEFMDLSWVSNSPSWLSWIPYNDTLDVLGIYPLIGTIVPQLVLLAITVVTFVMHIRHNRKIAAQAKSSQK